MKTNQTFVSTTFFFLNKREKKIHAYTYIYSFLVPLFVQSLVVWAIAEGRGAAARIDQFLMRNEALLAVDGDGDGDGDEDEDGRVVAYPQGIELATRLAAEVNYSSTLISECPGRKPSPSF